MAPETEDHDPAPDVDLDDLAFLDLDPDEMAARLGLTPAQPRRPIPEPRIEMADFLTLKCKRWPQG